MKLKSNYYSGNAMLITMQIVAFLTVFGGLYLIVYAMRNSESNLAFVSGLLLSLIGSVAGVLLTHLSLQNR